MGERDEKAGAQELDSIGAQIEVAHAPNSRTAQQAAEVQTQRLLQQASPKKYAIVVGGGVKGLDEPTDYFTTT